MTERQEKLRSIPIEKIPDTYDACKQFAKDMQTSFVRSISVEENGSNVVIDFSCRGRGNAANSIYVGFYYSENDEAYPMVFDTETLTQTSPGVYEWENEVGDHKIYTERIIKNWFYYRVQYF